MKYSQLVELYERVSGTTKRLEKTTFLANFLKQVKEEKEILYLLEGNVFPKYSDQKIGISTQLAIKALSKATGVNEKEITQKWKSLGDLGEVAQELSNKKRQTTLDNKQLTTQKVITNITGLTSFEGKGTVDKKISLISELLSQASPVEAKYLMRTLIGDLRIGIQESTIRDSLSEAFFPDNKDEAKLKIQQAFEHLNDSAEVFILTKKGLKNLEAIELQVGKPLKVMLAQKASTVAEGFEIVGKLAALEYKYDGFRLLINKDKQGVISMFTRRLENVTKQFPDVAKYVSTHVQAKTFMIDAEIVGYDPKTKKYLPFQSISQRIKRKYDIEKMAVEFPIEINVFDALYVNGESLLKTPFEERSKRVRKIVKSEKFKIVPAKQLITDDEEQAHEFYLQALKENQEGVMMKALDAEYKPGSRVGYMLKIKPEENDLDLVIVGGEYGTGKRAGWISSYILACKDGNEFLTIGRVGTGFKEREDQQGETGISFEELTNKLKPYITEENGREVKIKPKIIITVTYQEIQASQSYTSGFALRFPRFRLMRPDKGLNDIATLEEVKSEYKKQSKK